MNIHHTIPDELKELGSMLSPELTGRILTVPEGYFEGFAASMLVRVRMDEVGSAADEIGSLSPLLAGLSRQMPFSLPDNYFSENSENLALAAAPDEESAVLSVIGREMPYQVPLGYFAGFPEKVLERVSQPKAKVVPLFARKWMKMAVAAVFIGVLAISGIFYLNRNDGSPVPQDAVATELKQASTQELNAFLKTMDVASAAPVIAKASVPKPKEVKSLLRDVSDGELEAFLNDMPSDELSSEEELDLMVN